MLQTWSVSWASFDVCPPWNSRLNIFSFCLSHGYTLISIFWCWTISDDENIQVLAGFLGMKSHLWWKHPQKYKLELTVDTWMSLSHILLKKILMKEYSYVEYLHVYIRSCLRMSPPLGLVSTVCYCLHWLIESLQGFRKISFLALLVPSVCSAILLHFTRCWSLVFYCTFFHYMFTIRGKRQRRNEGCSSLWFIMANVDLVQQEMKLM